MSFHSFAPAIRCSCGAASGSLDLVNAAVLFALSALIEVLPPSGLHPTPDAMIREVT